MRDPYQNMVKIKRGTKQHQPTRSKNRIKKHFLVGTKKKKKIHNIERKHITISIFLDEEFFSFFAIPISITTSNLSLHYQPNKTELRILTKLTKPLASIMSIIISKLTKQGIVEGRVEEKALTLEMIQRRLAVAMFSGGSERDGLQYQDRERCLDRRSNLIRTGK